MQKIFILLIFLSISIFSAELWVNDKTYSQGEIVCYQDELYQAQRLVYQNTPPPNTWFWSIYQPQTNNTNWGYITMISVSTYGYVEIKHSLYPGEFFYVKNSVLGKEHAQEIIKVIASAFEFNKEVKIYKDNNHDVWSIAIRQ